MVVFLAGMGRIQLGQFLEYCGPENSTHVLQHYQYIHITYARSYIRTNINIHAYAPLCSVHVHMY